MKLGTLRREPGTVAVLILPGTAVEIPGFTDVGALLQEPGWREIALAAKGTAWSLDDLAPTDWAPVIPAPGKIICVGWNYAGHIAELGAQPPEFPTLFTKFPEALVGPYDPIVLPLAAPDQLDWEGELAVVLGERVRHVPESEAEAAIGGYAVLNDVSARDFQFRTSQWLQGKTFEQTTPLGPYLVTADEFRPGGELRTDVDGELMQRSRTDDLVWSPARLISYISEIVTLNPGDVIATGTPGGVGHARQPPRYLADGAVLTTTIDGIGTMTNPVVAEA